MQLLRATKKVNGKIEQAKIIIHIFSLLSDLKLSESELTIMAYFAVYVDNTKVKDLVLKGNILKSEDSLRNTISKLKSIGLIKKSPINKEYVVHERINFAVEPVIGFIIKIDNR